MGLFSDFLMTISRTQNYVYTGAKMLNQAINQISNTDKTKTTFLLC